jgi:hypothetical protein
MVVLPGLDLIISWNDTKIEGREMENHAMKLLVGSVTSTASLSGRIIVDPEHSNGLSATNGKSYIMCASQLQGKIGLKNMQAVEYKLRWFDCATCSEVTEKNVTVVGGDQSWHKPDRIGSELAVYIKRIRGL